MTADMVRFGPAGNSDSFAEQGHKSTLEAPAYCAGLGLTAYEYQCGRGVRVSEATAKAMKAEAEKHGVRMSLHAPYYISLSSPEEEKRKGSARYFLESAQAVSRMGGTRFVVHSGSCGKQSREQALALAKQQKRARRDGTEYSLPCQMINCFCMYSDYTPLTLDEWIEADAKRRGAPQ